MAATKSDPTVEERLERLETLIQQVIGRARRHPIGRKVLAILGLT